MTVYNNELDIDSSDERDSESDLELPNIIDIEGKFGFVADFVKVSEL